MLCISFQAFWTLNMIPTFQTGKFPLLFQCFSVLKYFLKFLIIYSVVPYLQGFHYYWLTNFANFSSGFSSIFQYNFSDFPVFWVNFPDFSSHKKIPRLFPDWKMLFRFSRFSRFSSLSGNHALVCRTDLNVPG